MHIDTQSHGIVLRSRKFLQRSVLRALFGKRPQTTMATFLVTVLRCMEARGCLLKAT